MDTFFSTIYYYTNGLYCEELDSYLYETVPGYIHAGLTMIVSSAIFTAIFYYMLKPVRRQWVSWFVCMGLNALVNLFLALWYTNTPLINNEIDSSESWTVLDTFGFGVANIIWSVIFVHAISLLIKWWSPAKYIPFRKF